MTTTPQDAFHWSDERWGRALRCERLARVAEHLFTTRQLQLRAKNVSPETSAAAVEAAWAQAAAAVGAPSGALMRVKQVHGREVRVLKAGTVAPDAAAARPEADALVSDAPGFVLVVQVADCVPVLMADPRHAAAGAAHAGWRGTAAAVTRATVEAMTREFGTDAADLIVAIGPSIGACCYSVGAELIDAFRSGGASEEQLARWFTRTPDGDLRLDLWAANRDQLLAAGVGADRIFTAGLCTQTNADTFDSFRAQGPNAGRMAALIAVPRVGAAARHL
jgi:purine-nucleoside/S-methyl-5'-thioadenosine phosphorylase / adenosine deaminase